MDKVGTIRFNDNNLNVTFGDDGINSEIVGNWSIYNNIYVNGTNVYFAMHEYLTSEECLEDRGNCICHFGATKLFILDTKNNTLSQTMELESGSFLISYDENGYVYYNSGKIFLNNVELKSVEAIIPSTTFYQYGDTAFLKGTEIANSLFCFYEKTLYYDKLSFDVQNEYYS